MAAVTREFDVILGLGLETGAQLIYSVEYWVEMQYFLTQLINYSPNGMGTVRRYVDHLTPYGHNYKVVCARPGLAVILIFDIRTLWRLGLSVRVPKCQTLQMTA